ncbi:MAG TPA: hypothetical protein PKY56_12100 [Candidatus Kapabacteria bacterium]|nr:hypothetical protein [Candidatus Kapabacteria bacterium]
MKKITLFFLLMLISVSSIFSQEITEGREYWFGLPYCKMKQHENIRGDSPIMVWFAAGVDKNVSMTIHEIGVDKIFNNQANQVTQIKQYDLYLEGRNGIKFAGYAFSNWDRKKDSIAFGYPVETNYYKVYNDSIYVVDSSHCGYTEGEFFAVDLDVDSSCAGIATVMLKEKFLRNCSFQLDDNFTPGDKSAKFSISPVDIKEYVGAVVMAQTTSGKTLERYYSYIPERIGTNNKTINFGILKVNEARCQNFTLVNYGGYPLTIYGLHLKNNLAEFSVTNEDFPITIDSEKSKIFEACATSLEYFSNIKKDTVVVVLSCFEQPIVELLMRTAEQSLWISDASVIIH